MFNSLRNALIERVGFDPDTELSEASDAARFEVDGAYCNLLVDVFGSALRMDQALKRTLGSVCLRGR